MTLSIGKSLCVAAALLALTPATLAQSGNNEDNQGRMLEEVFVTARKKVESLQEAPIAVTAIGGEQLKERGLNSLSDLKGFVPGLDLNTNNGATRDANPFIRGVGQRETRVTIDSAVATYINGVYIGRNSGALLDFADIEQVQVLRGPQGTLFGKNTTGGAMVIDTIKPQPEFSLNLKGTLGKFNQRNGVITANVPLIEDRLFGRLTLSSVHRDGFRTNTVDGSEWYDDDREGFMGQLRWEPSDAHIVDFFVSGTSTNQRPAAQRCVYAGDDRGLPDDDTIIEAGFAQLEGANFIREVCEGSEFLPHDEFKSNMTGAPAFPKAEYVVDTRTAAVTWQWELADGFLGLGTPGSKTILAFRNTRSQADEDLDGTELPIIERYVPAQNNTDQYSFESQINGDLFDGMVNLTTGIYLFQERTRDDKKFSIALGPYATATSGGAGIPAGQPVILLGSALYDEREADNRAMSWFAQADINFTEQWALALGMRYTYEERISEITESAFDYGPRPAVNADGNEVYSSANFGPCTLAYIEGLTDSPYSGTSLGQGGSAAVHFYNEPPGTVPVLNAQATEADYCNLDKDTGAVKGIDWTPMASLRFIAGDDFLDWSGLDSAMFFFTYSEGFRSGGVVDGPNLPGDDNPALGGADAEVVGGVDSDLDSFEPEQVTNFEIGAKLEGFDRRLRANMQLFYTDYTDIQLTNVRVRADTGQPEPFIDNAGKAIIQGFEAEIYAVLWDNLLITSSFAWTDADVKEYITPVLVPNSQQPPLQRVIDREDEPQPTVPEYQAFLGADYEIHTRIGTFLPGVNIRYYDEVSRHFDRGSFESGIYVSDPEVFVDARLLWTSPGEQIDVVLWARNVTDVDDYLQGGVPLVEFVGGGGQVLAEPRTYGIDFRYRME